MKSTVIALALAASSVSALNLTSGCQSVLTGILGNKDAQCLNPTGVTGFLTIGNGSSIVQPLDQYIGGLCSAPACSNSTIQAVFTNVSSGCSNELKALGVDVSNANQLIPTVQAFYPAIRQALCLKESNTLCPTKLLTALQNTTGNITLSNLGTVVQGLTSASTKIPKAVICDDCTKATFNVIEKQIPGLLNTAAKSGLNSTCGANFTDGQTPSTITETASGSNTSTGNGTNGGSSTPSGAAGKPLMFNVPAAGIVFSFLITVAAGASVLL